MHRLAHRGANVQLMVLLVCIAQIAAIGVSLLAEVPLLAVIGAGSVVSSSLAVWLASGCTNIGPVLGRAQLTKRIAK